MDIGHREEERQRIVSGQGPSSQDLISKLRSGELTQEQVELLSYLGYESAQVLIPTTPPEDLEDFADGLASRNNDMTIIAAVIAARAAIPIFEAEFPNDSRPREAVEAAEDVIRTGQIGQTSTTIWHAVDACLDAALEVIAFVYAHGAVLSAAAAADVAGGGDIFNHVYSIRHADMAGVKNVRELIEQGLIKLVLDGN